MDLEASNPKTTRAHSREQTGLIGNAPTSTKLTIVYSIAAGIFAVLLFIVMFMTVPNKASESLEYSIWCIGNCDTDAVVTTTPGAVLMGGETDVNEAFMWQIKNANGGDFTVLRVDGTDAYNSYIYDISKSIGHQLNSVRTISFHKQSAAQSTEVLNFIQNSEAIWFAGGDQYYYMDWWRDTQVQSIIQSKVNDITIGGTSAGCAILGNYVFNNSYDHDTTLHSYEAMQNPYAPKVTVGSGLIQLPYLTNVITDTHFVERNRMGRMLTFVAKLVTETNNVNIRGIGVDGWTALLLNYTTGTFHVVGNDTAHICGQASISDMIVEHEVPLTFQNVSCVRVDSSSTYNLASDIGTNIVRYCNNITNGFINPDHYGPPFAMPDDFYYYGYSYANEAVVNNA